MSHTPGPWVYDYGQVWNENRTVSIARADRDEPKTAPTERDANCRLIAAAPELLETLKQLVVEVDQHIETDCEKFIAVCEHASNLIRDLKNTL